MIHKNHWEGKEISRHDKYLQQKELTAEVTQKREKEYQELVGVLKKRIEAYFPNLAAEVNFCTYSDYLKQYNQDLIDDLDDEDNEQIEETDVFLVAVAIRYIDNFIDKVLWPKVGEFDPNVLERLFYNFLDSTLEVVKIYDPEMPDEIIELPQLELHLELNPNQKEFDANIKMLIQRKSLDMAYINQKKFGGERLDTIDEYYYMKEAIDDYNRDFRYNRKDPDFDLHRYLEQHPEIKLDVLVEVIQNYHPNYISYDDWKKNDVVNLEILQYIYLRQYMQERK